MIHRLNYLLLAACVLLSSGCGCSAGSLNYVAGSTSALSGLEVQHESARLVSSLAVPREASEIISGGGAEITDILPGLWFIESSGRAASEVTEHTKYGSQTFATGGNTVVTDNSLSMISPSGSSFGLYEVGGVGSTAQLETLTINTSSGYFKGDHPGYWVGIADFDAKTWDILGLSEETEYQRSFGGTGKYTSNGGNLYVFVLITGGQAVYVNSIAMEVDTSSAWTDVEVDAGPNAGWTPAITFLQSDNPMVVYSDYDSTNPMYAAIDRSYDVSNPANWYVGDMALPTAPELGHWMDLTVDPAGNPVASMVISNVGTGTTNSQLAYAVYADKGEYFSWDFLLLPKKDGLEYTSIAYNPVSDNYTVAFSAANQNSSAADYDMYLQIIDIGDPDDSGDDTQSLISGFATRYPGVEFRYPHIDLRGTDAYAAVCVNGGYVYAGPVGGADNWIEVYTQANSGLLGSIRFNPVSNLLSQTYSHNTATSATFYFVDYDSGFIGQSEIVDSLTVTGGETIAESSQVAYTDAGGPGIVYTASEGSVTNIMFAYWKNSAWSIERVNDEPLYPGGERIFVDLDFDSTDMPGICWNHIAGGNCSLHVAFNGV